MTKIEADIPEKTYDEFMKLVDDEFRGDTGMAIKFLFDNALKFYSLFSAIDELMSRVSRLEEKQKLPKELKMINGSIKKIGKR